MIRQGNNKTIAVIATGAATLAIVLAVVFLSSPPTASGSIGCLFYSAQSKSSAYIVYATLSNNSTYPTNIAKVYFDGYELAYSIEFLGGVSGIWSMQADGQHTTVLGATGRSTLSLAASGADPEVPHNVRVTTNTSSLEFTVERKTSLLLLNDYHIFVGPGIDYMVGYVDNVGTSTGNIVQVALDGDDYGYVCNVAPPNFRYQWSSVVGGLPTTYIAPGQQAQIYVNTAGICHSCTHILRVSSSDGSSVEFSFKLW